MEGVLIPFWNVREPMQDLLFVVLLVLMLLSALVTTRISSFWGHVGDALLYERTHLLYRMVARQMPLRLFTSYTSLQRYFLEGINLFLLLNRFERETSFALGLRDGVQLVSCVLVVWLGATLYLLVNRLLAWIYLDREVYAQWQRYYQLLQWPWTLFLFFTAWMLLIGVNTMFVLICVGVGCLLWRLAVIIQMVLWVSHEGINPLLISLYLCAQELVLPLYIVAGVVLCIEGIPYP